jgi:pyridoxal phosphate enzyme (YggS family)
MNDLKNKLDKVRARIAEAGKKARQGGPEVRLLAVSKLQPVDKIRALFGAGQREFGENYVQEALHKQQLLADLDIRWHFIGPLQSNKTREVAQHFSWVQSVDREKSLRRLSAQRPPELPPLNVCLQVNISAEQSKSGCLPDDVLALAREVARLPRLKLRGLMAIPAASQDPQHQQHAFAAMRTLLQQLQTELPQLDTLSMGMSGDMDAAIAEGASIVRIGTAIFGARNSNSTTQETPL